MSEAEDTRQPASDREDFDVVQAIPDEAFIRLFLQKMTFNGSYDAPCRVKKRMCGSFHLCIFIEADDVGTFVVKVPAAGTVEFWHFDEDGANLRSEVGTMKLIRAKTNIPVPRVHAFDATFKNPIGAPYILMDAMPGEPATELWLGYSTRELKGSVKHQEVAHTMPEQEWKAKKLNFLKSLASYMAELSKLSFDAIGKLNFDIDEEDPFVDDWFVWDDDERAMMESSTSDTSKDIFSGIRVGIAFNLAPYMVETPMYKGMLNFYDWLFQCAPFTHSRAKGDSEESFALMHGDLHLRNILVDSEGNVTGLIDWDNTLTFPRAVGPTSLPVFLEEDWFVSGHNPHLTQSLDPYRAIYARHMIAATGCDGDGLYTSKSHIYSAALRAQESLLDATRFVEKFIQVSADLRERYDVETLLCEAGKWTGGLEEPIYVLLRQTVMPEVLRPTAPSES